MKKFIIKYTYSRSGFVEIEAESLEEAKELALEASIETEDSESYVDDSFTVDAEFSHEVKENESE